MTRLQSVLGALVLAGSVTGCGLTGELQRPDPIFGNPDDRGAASLPDRQVDPGLPETPNSGADEDDDETSRSNGPDANDELLGGPGGA